MGDELLPAISLKELEKLPSGNIKSLIKEIRDACKIITMENAMLERYMTKPNVDALQSVHELDSDITAKLGRSQHRPTPPSSERIARLTPQQLCEVAQHECEEMKKHKGNMQRDCEMVVAQSQAELEEMRIFTDEIRVQKMFFERKVCGALKDVRRKFEAHTAFTSFHRSYLRSMDTLVQNLGISNANLQGKLKQLHRNLRDCDGEDTNLTPIDFEEIELHGKVLVAKLRVLSNQCCCYKVRSNNCVVKCEALKMELLRRIEESKILRRILQQRFDVTNLILKELNEQHVVCTTTRTSIDKLKKVRSSFKTPTIHNYMKILTESKELDSQKHFMNRKLHLAKIALKRHKNMWLRVKSPTEH
ncbi:hypothetical protein FGIG_03041 [Fasciola gigantica]|uniref:DUF4201 domain-containing protein n=1 Tax=Fasciola gigantica TaxID=46835 RepID=A0A504YY21_FASGI|nr:hypothetical protein FGIG_03041 [Fasciola gigantica]